MSRQQAGAGDPSLQTFIDAAPFGVQRYRDAGGGQLLLIIMNASAARILGTDTPSGTPIESIIPSLQDSPALESIRRIAREGGVFEDRRFLVRNAHGPRSLVLRAFSCRPGTVELVFDDAGSGAAFDEPAPFFAMGLESICVLDSAQNLVRVNCRWQEVLGWSTAECAGRPLTDFVHPDDLPEWSAAMEILRDTGRLPPVVNRFRCRDGSWRWIDWRAQRRAENVYAVARDVTEREKLRETVAERDELMASIFRATPVGIGVSVHRTVTEANDQLCDLTGYSRDEIIGMPTRRLYVDLEKYEETGNDLSYQEITLGAGTIETRWVRKDGTVFDVHVRTAPLLQGDLGSGVAFAVLDITERKKAEADRHALETRMLQTQKLESLGVLAGGIAHDFNNILMAVLGHADLAKSQLSLLSPAHESIEEIVKAARRAADLCRQMLAYSGKGRFFVQALDLNEVIRDMEHMLQVSISKKAVLRFTFTTVLPAVEADVAQVRQVIMNLVINASEALGESNGIIGITTGILDCDAAYLRAASLDQELPPGRYVFLEVSDNGVGMSPATQRRVFEPFFTTKFTGRGLGLSAVQGIVRGHKGTIKVYSEEGKGTAFKVLIPAVATAAVRVTSAADPPTRWKGNGTVLVADDEESVRLIARQMLERLGFTVILAADGRQAVREYVGHRGGIFCVIMDLTMPEMDGEEAFRAIRRADPECRVLLSSGYNEQEAVQRFLGKGLAGFLQKPYQLSVLEEKLRGIIEKKS